ncbi:glycosyltransferase [Olleya sp. AH-315-F22]|nr:glycosyltransferase [Olleya sp. AH-315-F22]
MRVLQLIDSLNAGGAERVAVNIANALSLEIDKSFICATRKEGILKESIDKDVGYVFLNKQSTLDFKAILKLKRFIKEQRINIIHAHSSSFFIASIMRLFKRDLKIIWHDHYGNSEFLEKRPLQVLKVCSRSFSHIFCVNRKLEKWDKQHLHCKSVSYLQNFAVEIFTEPTTNLFGVNGKRILCLANLRPQKDHNTLIKAFKKVNKQYPNWTLHCVGQDFNDDYSRQIFSVVNDFGFQESIFFYGSRPEVSSIIKQCEIGVLSSKSEGLPMALLEYGLNGLAVVVTDVGECKEVVSEFGLLVPAEDYKALSNAIVNYIKNVDRRLEDSKNFQNRVNEKFSSLAVITKTVSLYKAL